MIRVLYFAGAEGSAENISGHDGVQVVRPNGDEAAYITWATAGSIPARRINWLKVKWARPYVQAGYGVTIPSRQKDEQNYLAAPQVVELPALTETQAGLDEEALLHWWWGFSLDLGRVALDDGHLDHSKMEGRADYSLMTKSCTTISAMALMAGGMHHYADMGASTGTIGKLAPQKLRSKAFNMLWRPKALYEAALAAKAKIDAINQDHRRLQAVLQREHALSARAGRFMNDTSGMVNGLWTLAAWKTASKGSSALSHRYATLKRIDEQVAAYHATSTQDTTSMKMRLHELAVAIHQQLSARPASNRRPAVMALGGQVYRRMNELKVADIQVNKGSPLVLERRLGEYRRKAETLMEEAQLVLEASDTSLDQMQAIALEIDGDATAEKLDDLMPALWDLKYDIGVAANRLIAEFDKLLLSSDPKGVYADMQTLRANLDRDLKRFMELSAQVTALDKGKTRGRRRSGALAPKDSAFQAGRQRGDSFGRRPSIGQGRSRANSGGLQNQLAEQYPSDEGWEDIEL